MEGYGYSVSGAGDIDGDGFADVIVGSLRGPVSGKLGAVYVYSGVDGAMLFQFHGRETYSRFGCSVSDAGDVNADGVGDLIVGAEEVELDRTGAAYVFSGADGSLLHEWKGGGTKSYFGCSVSGAGDVNSDGFDDLIVGAHGATTSYLLAGSASVYSGADGTLLYLWGGSHPYDKLGSSVSRAGDIDGDGYDDVLVGAEGDGPTGAGSVFLYSGATGSLIFQWDGSEPDDAFGDSVGAAGDVDGDGFVDLIVGASAADAGGKTDAGIAYLYSGSNGALIRQWEGTDRRENLGRSVAGAGDLNRDGLDDLLVGASYSIPVTGYGFHPFLVSDTSTLPASTPGAVRFALDFSRIAADHGYRVLLSLSGEGPLNYGIQIPLTMDTLVEESSAGSFPSFMVPFQMNGFLNSEGRAFAGFSTPAGIPPSGIGKTLYFAAVASPPGGTPEASSVVVPITILP